MSKFTHDDDDDDEPLSLNMDTLAALQSVMGSGAAGGGGDGTDDLLAQLLHSRRMMHDDSSSGDEEEEEEDEEEDEDSDGMRKGETHAEYYRRLYPERYANETGKDGSNDESSKIENPVALVTMEDEYVQDLILSAFAKRPHWGVITQIPSNKSDVDDSKKEDESKECNYDLHWGEYEHINWFSSAFTAEKTVVSCYYNRKGMIRKGNLASILEKWQSKYKGIKKPLAPKSYVLRLPILPSMDDVSDGQDAHKETVMDQKFVAAFEKSYIDSGFPGFSNPSNQDSSNENNRQMSNEPNQVFILKPSVTNQANGISLVRSKTQLQQAIYKSDAVQLAGDFVLQQYIPPLLLDKRKFHLRVFMLLHGNVTALVYPDFLAIFSLEPYENADLDNTRAHLTNIAHQEVLSLDDQHRCMRRFDETKQDMLDAGLVETIEEATEKIDLVQKRVYEIIAEMVEAVTAELTFVCKNNCFELFGLDFMIDPEWNTWLLEANAEPDLSKAGDRLQCVIDQMLQETLEVVVDNNPKFGVKDEDKQTNFVKVFERKGRSF